jgi:hypothetical protein
MAVILLSLQRIWASSIFEATTLTMSGVAIVVIGLRAVRVMGPEEVEILGRASIPGRQHLIRWLQNPRR